MPRNGSGTASFASSSWNPAVGGTAISDSDWNTKIATDILAMLTQSVSKDGQTPWTGNMAAGNHKITGMIDGTAATDSATVGQASGAAVFQFCTVGGTADAITLTPNPAISAYAAGQEFWGIASGTNTTAVTINVSAVGNKAGQANGAALVAGDIQSGRLMGWKYDGTQFQKIASRADKTHTADIADAAVTFAKMQAITDGTLLGASGGTTVEQISIGAGLALSSNTLSANVLGNYLGGLILANGSDAAHDIDFGAGAAADSTNAFMMTFTALTKQLDATWAAGTNAGGLFSGSTAVGANGSYHCFIIRKTSDSTLDAGFDSDVAAAHIPAGYGAFRRVGSIKLDGSSNILAFKQRYDYFELVTPLIDIDATNPGTSAVLRALSIPSGLILGAVVDAGHYSGTTSNMASYFSAPDQTDSAPQAPGTAALTALLNGAQTAASTAFWRLGRLTVYTNTSAQIRSRLSASSTADHLGIITNGWIDTRGK